MAKEEPEPRSLLPLLTSPQEATPEWLTAVLQDGGYLQTGRVTNVVHETGSSVHAHNARLQLSYSNEAQGDCPSALFLKISPQGTPFGDSEVRYYTQIAPRIPQPPMPHCYHAHYDLVRQQYHLLLADVSNTHSTNRAKTPTLAQAGKTVVAMARLHAAWWAQPDLPEVGSWPETAVIDRYVQSALEGIQPLLAETLEQISPEWVELIQLIAERHGDQMKVRAADTNMMTFIHGDPNPGNIFSPHNEVDGQALLIDHQPFPESLTIWLGVSDLAYMIVHWWEVERRRAWEQPLLRRYHQALQKLGITHYTFAQLWHDYRLCAMQSLYIVAAWCADPDEQQEFRWVWWPQLQKTMTACLDLDCADLL